MNISRPVYELCITEIVKVILTLRYETRWDESHIQWYEILLFFAVYTILPQACLVNSLAMLHMYVYGGKDW